MVKRINRVSGQTPYRQELRERILKAAMSEFFEKGIKAVKMDDIARRLSISKRTVYEIYSNKEELLLEGMKAAEQEFDEHMKDFSEQDNHHAMDILIEFYNCQAHRLSEISPLYFDEVQKYKRVQTYLENKHKKRDEDAYNFIDRGVKEGFFRPDTNYPKSVIRDFSCKKLDYSRLFHRYSIYILTQYASFTLFQDKMKAKFSNDRFGIITSLWKWRVKLFVLQ